MLERYFVRPDTVDRIQSSWIGGAIDQYVTWLSEQDYSWRSVSRRVPLLVKFGDHARAQGATSWADLPAHIDSFVASWLENRVKEPKSSQALRKLAKDLQNPIQQMLRLILPDFAGMGRPVKPENPFQQLAPDFFVYLRQERGLRETSILHYSHYLRQFAAYLESIGLTDLRHLSPPVLSGFVSDLSQKVRWASTRDACGVVRVLLRYLYRQRALPRDLSGVVEQPHTYRLSNIPRSITWDEVRRMLEAVDLRTCPYRKLDLASKGLLITFG